MVKSVSSDTIKEIARSGPESQVNWKSPLILEVFLKDVLFL